MRRIALAAVLGVLAFAPARAIEKGQWEVGIGPDFHYLDNGMDSENKLAPRIRFGWHFGEKIEIELGYQRLETEDDTGATEAIFVDYQTAAVNALFSMGSEDFQPFVMAGVGYADLDLEAKRGVCNPQGPGTPFSQLRGCLPDDLGSIDIDEAIGGKGRVSQVDDQGFLWQAGFGVRWSINRRVGFRVQLAGARVGLFDTSFTNLGAGVDVSFLWGQPK